eukprot:6184665-Pleurochrysis_carterae.AAC.1
MATLGGITKVRMFDLFAQHGQRTTRHAEAEEEEGEIHAGRTSNPVRRCRAAAGGGNDGDSSTCRNRGIWKQEVDQEDVARWLWWDLKRA